ncbi:MAG: HAMP domain-containing sensor histidine kinase [Oculatellaceae cyanobacterium bins.114]|nr:HAMP domain-containing sensor histidine kinase [Oculatellaceae cyanobacterium bins.114]
MNFFRKAHITFDQIRRQWFSPTSLQFRLTAGITIALVLGLGGVALWIGWGMQQLLVTTHIQNVEYIVDRFPHDVGLYRDMFSPTIAVQRAILQAEAGGGNEYSSSLLIWVSNADGDVLVQSRSLQAASPSFQAMLMSLSAMPIQPQVYQISDRYLVLSSSPLMIDRSAFGQLYVAQDITEEQLKLMTAIRHVSLTTILAILLLPLLIAVYIRRSLQPLRRMSQLAETISADDLSQVRLYLDSAPDEVQELAQMLDKMFSRLSQSWEQYRQLVGNVSHELRTPLSIISGYLQSLLRRKASLSGAQIEALEIATSETDRTIQLLQDLLDLARLDGGYLNFCWETIVLNDLLEEIVGMSERFSDRSISIEADSPAIQIKTDRDRLTQVLVNLIDNAVKYSEPSDLIVVRLAQTEEHTTIEILDQGCGIPLHHQTRIFERFYRVDEARTRYTSGDSSRTTAGVGLGLAVVKSLVKSMGGHVAVSSKPGEGSTFTITLPNL